MVEYSLLLDDMFHCLADSTRRDILYRLAQAELSVGELAEKYDVSLAAVSKHLKVLQQARLICKRKEGRRYVVALEPEALKEVDTYLEQYRRMWQSRVNKLNSLLTEGEV